MKEIKVPKLIEGDLAVDDRGRLTFANDFDFKGVKRFYMVANHLPGFVRAWHAHKKEAKYVLVAQGAAVVGAVEIKNWQRPNKKAQVYRYVLSAQKPALLYIPPGFANGFMTLTAETQVIFFSTSSLEESKGDDFRFPARYWDIWGVEER